VNRETWDERYATEELIWKADPNRFLVEEADRLEPGRALDVACGEGRNAVWLASKGWRVTGVVEWRPPAASFDLVIVMYLHMVAGQRRQVLATAVSAVAPGGTVLVVGHDISNLQEGTGGPQDPAVLFSPEDIVEDLPGLQIARAERVKRTVVLDDAQMTAVDALVRAVRPR
jgi:SAM-dependent methyltransferase